MVEKIHSLVSAIKSRKGLETLDDEFVRQKIEKIFSGNAKLEKKFDESKNFDQFSRSKEYDALLKTVRKELRAVYGVFQGDKRDVLLKSPGEMKEKEAVIKEILMSHTSTRERIPYYDEIACELTKRIPTPKRIIDLGCGMNPVAYHYFAKHGWKPEIFASDISSQDMEFLTDAFRILHICGKAKRMDLITEYEHLKTLEGDVTLLLKLLDSLEEAKRHISYKIFDCITTPWIVASFPTKSLGGKKSIASAGRTWFERLLKRKELVWETFSVQNEMFYVIRNKQ